MTFECGLCHLRDGSCIELTAALGTFLQIVLPEDLVSRVLQIEHILTLVSNTLEFRCAKRLVNKVERLDTSGIGLHQTIAPLSECILNGVILLLLGLLTVVVRRVLNMHITDIEDGVHVTFKHQVTLCGSL